MFLKIRHRLFFHNLYWIGTIVTSVMIVSSVLIGAITTFVNPQKDSFVQIPINISSKEQANYGDGVEQFVFPGIDVAIVDEILRDSENINQLEMENRLTEIANNLQQPIPIATENSELVVENTPTEQNNETAIIPTNTLSFTPTRNSALTMIPVTGTSTSTQPPTLTASLTVVPSYTNTFNPTITWSPTLTRSVSPTFSPTLTNTRTFTITPTSTSSRTPTFTFTPTFTSSVTPTFTYTLTPTSSKTPTLTITPTFTSSVTTTFTMTPTRTNTATFTFTPSVTNSITPTYTITVTQSMTPSTTPTFTITPSPTATYTICNTTPKTELIKYMWPSDGSVDVPVDVIPVIVFDQSIDPTTLVYGDPSRIVICQKSSDNSNACRNGTEVNATLEIKSTAYINDWVIIHLLEDLDAGVLYTMFAGNQIKTLPECSSYSSPMGGREQSNFTTLSE